MAVALIGAGGLFTRLGKLGKLSLLANQHQAALPAAVDAVLDQFDGQPDRSWTADFLNQYDAILANPATFLPLVQNAAARVLLEMVKADVPAAGVDLPTAINELRRQMVATVDTVATCATSASTASAILSTANGRVMTTVLRGDGVARQNVLAEVGSLVCIGDSFAGGFVAGQEPFRYTGGPMVADRLAYDWPGGSGAVTDLNAVDATADPSATGQLLVNGGFEDAAVSNTPDNWSIESGSAGTQVFVDTAAPYSGLACLKFAGHATKAAVSQTFGSDTGTALIPASLTNYAYAFKIKVTGGPAAGVLTVELTDSTNANVADDAGTPNLATIDLTMASSSWADPVAATGSFVFRLPRVVPTGLKLRIRLSTALSVGSSVFLDHEAMTPMVDLYPGGPSAAVFAGAIPFAVRDGWTVTGANDRASASYLATWQALFDRWFGMREMGLQLPFAGLPTIADTLITA